MAKTINKNRLEIRLDPDSQALLDSLVVRTSLTKTSLIKKALIVYASALKNGHIYTVKLKAEEQKEEKKTEKTAINDVQDEDDYKVFDELAEESKRLEEERLKKEEDELPF